MSEHMTYREAAEVVRDDPRDAGEWSRAMALLAELGARTDGPDRPVVVGDRLWSWDAVEALPVGTFVHAANGCRGVRDPDGKGAGFTSWVESGDVVAEWFPITVVSLPGDPLPPEPTP